MNLQIVCEHFNLPPVITLQPMESGLINSSYKVICEENQLYFLQNINTSIFTNPPAIQHNYKLIEKHLANTSGMLLPKSIPTTTGELLLYNNGSAWRCFEFLKNTYSPNAVQTPQKAYEVANCFGSFTAALHSLDSKKLTVILPRFHDLSFRYQQFQTALHNASEERKKEAKTLIQRAENYTFLVDWFNRISSDNKAFPLHIMHHDCKISNILFDAESDAIRCPIDLDTTQPGLFFSDMGDMIRTIAPNRDENDTERSDFHIRPEFLKAVNEGYLDAMSPYLTPKEKENMKYAGSALTYMQALRFLADYLNGDTYYKIHYPEQNKDRTENQLLLLDLLQLHWAGQKALFVY